MFRPFRDYSADQFPLGAYAALAGAYATIFGALAAAAGRRRRLPRPEPFDLVLFGAATHKLSRIVARDWVTSPFRAPFTRYESPASGGEVREQPRGSGLRRAVGDLVTCPFCVGPWVAGALVSAFAVSPRRARLAAAAFAYVTISDFLHRAYDALGEKRSALAESAKELAASGGTPRASRQGELVAP